MVQQKKSKEKKKYVLRFSPFFWRLGHVASDSSKKNTQLSPLVIASKEPDYNK